MQKSIFFSLTALLMAAFLSQSCKPEEPVGEEEITTVQLVFNGSETFTWKDGATPDSIIISPNTTYSVAARFLNENVSPAEDITAEILAESDEHLICFDVLGSANLAITRTDTDGTYEVGLSSEWQTGDNSKGQVSLKLRHQPGGVKDGTCNPGDSDVEVVFEVVIR